MSCLLKTHEHIQRRQIAHKDMVPANKTENTRELI